MATAKSIKRSQKQQSIFRFALLAALFVLLNMIGSFFYTRLDLTADKRFTLHEHTRELVRNVDDQLFVKVYLTGDLPAGFKRLEQATRDLLNELRGYNKRIHFQFEDPLEGKSNEEKKTIYEDMMARGLQPTNIQTAGGDAYAEKIAIPGATIFYKGREASVNLLLNEQGVPAQRALNNSVSRLENKFTAAIEGLSIVQPTRIAILRGHGELPLYKMYDFANALSEFYQVDTLDLRTVLNVPPSRYKALIVAKPTRAFAEREKYKLDQYAMNGGNILWLLDGLRADMDSLQVKPAFLAIDYALNLEDQLFAYGVRLNPALLMDLQCNPVPLLVNYINNQPEFRLFPCYYFPVLTPPQNNTHPITQEIDAVYGSFMTTLDTAQLPGIRKTVLLTSSRLSRQAFTPWQVDFRTMKEEPNRALFNKRFLPTAVLLEGNFNSVFKNRLAAEFQQLLSDSLQMPYRDQSAGSRQIVVADGDIAANEFSSQGRPHTLGFYKYTGEHFANKNFLLNAVDYLTGHEARIATRGKDVKLRMLDADKVKAEKTKWQLINVVLPVVLVIVFGVVYAFVRLRRFAT